LIYNFLFAFIIIYLLLFYDFLFQWELQKSNRKLVGAITHPHFPYFYLLLLLDSCRPAVLRVG